MKKVFSFLRSMRFGMILLVAVIACSLAGSLIVQQGEPMAYVQRYGADAARVILALGLDDVFSTPYFIVLAVALCVNLLLCSLLRFPATRSAKERLIARAARCEKEKALTPAQHDVLLTWLKAHRFRATQDDGVYLRGSAGFYGSFVTHLSILLVLGVGSATLLFADVQDTTVMPGATLSLEDGTTIEVLHFQIEDDTGRLDYASELRMTAPDGKTAEQTIRVNEPMRFGAYKVYQQTYGTAGGVRVTNLQNGAQDDLTLTEPCFLTLDGRNGLFFQALYPGYTQDAQGNVTLITSTSGAYTDPVYDVRSMAEGAATPVLAFPGETLTIGDVSFTMLDPVSYPGLRIKRMPGFVLGALYAVFVLMIAGLYLCFFITPVCVRVWPDGYAVCSPKAQTGLTLALDMLLEEKKEETP